ncbi:uncharacterized protein M6B38_166260 [Iris pallida]|uniref:Uncharacterized protein n=1 Tax=Iris pallida TaxID=29817 RepID=A0AAX6EXL2_IRIPA|nr:uncharacterized protein M6B38_166260 [Iris pallida]
MPNIVFTPQDMLIKTNLHDHPLYYTGYIGDVKVDRMHIDPGSSISIIPKGLLHHLCIPMHRLTPTSTAISGFNSGRSYPIGKIRLKCQIGDLQSEVTCYVIDADTSYNILLGCPWIHDYMIVPSTLHQCFKYVDKHGFVKIEFADIDLFKGVESYYSDSCLYEKSKRHLDEGNEQASTEMATESEGPLTIHLQARKPGKSAPLTATLRKDAISFLAQEEQMTIRLPRSSQVPRSTTGPLTIRLPRVSQPQTGKLNPSDKPLTIRLPKKGRHLDARSDTSSEQTTPRPTSSTKLEVASLPTTPRSTPSTEPLTIKLPRSSSQSSFTQGVAEEEPELAKYMATHTNETCSCCPSTASS